MGDALLIIHQTGAALAGTILGRDGTWLARRELNLPVHSDSPDQAEADAHDISIIVGEILTSVVEAVGPDRIGGAALVSESGSTLLWERKGSRPVTPVVLGPDRRGAELSRSFRDRGWDEAFLRRTGRIPEAAASGFKLSVLLSETPRALDHAADGDLAFGSIGAYLIWRLSGSRIHAMDRTDAAASMLFNLERLDWDSELLEVFNVPHACLPSVFPSAYTYAETTLGSRLPNAVPLAASVLQREAGMYGLGLERTDAVFVSLDASAEAVRAIGSERPAPAANRAVRMVLREDGHTQFAFARPLKPPRRLFQWLRALDLPDDPDRLNRRLPAWHEPGTVRLDADMAAGEPPGRRVKRADALEGFESGTPDEAAACAVLETSALAIRQAVEDVMDGVKPVSVVLTGPAAQINVLVQRVADLCGCPAARASLPVAALAGAARLGAAALGWQDADLTATPESVYKPAMTAAARKKAIARSRR